MSLHSQDKPTENLDLKEIISLYTKHWKWFVLSGFISLAIAYVYLRYEIPEYIAEAKIQIVDEGSSGSGLSLFKDLDMLSNGNTEVLDEIVLLNSRSNFIEVVKTLGLNTKIMAQGNIIDTELYTNPPVKVNFIAADSIINKSSFSFYLQLSSTTTFGYAEEEDMPLVGVQDLHDHTNGGGLARTVGADEAVDASPEHFQAELVHCGHLAEGFGDLLQFNNIHKYLVQ